MYGGHFKQQMDENSGGKTWTWLRKGKLKRETESLLIAAQNNCNILTSDPAELSDEKCTCVNNRCIRSKISGDNLDCGQVELSVNCDATGSKWT